MVGFKEAGCAAVVPTYTDGYLYQNGWGLTSGDYTTFVRWMAATARSLGLGFGLRDSAELVTAATVDVWDFAWDVGCFSRGTCAAYLPFTQGGRRSWQLGSRASGITFTYGLASKLTRGTPQCSVQ
jgi:hypothetical protein